MSMVTAQLFFRIVILLEIFLFFHPDSFAQSRDKTIEDESITRIIGRNFEKQENIFGKEIPWQGLTRNIYPDTINNRVFVQLEKFSKSGYSLEAGTLLAIDAGTDQILWRKKVRNSLESLNPKANFLMLDAGLKCQRLDPKNGKALWTNNNKISYGSRKWNIGIVDRLGVMDGRIPKLKGISLDTGEEIWERVINSKYNWSEILIEGDSVVFVLADALYSIHLKDGKGWKCEVFNRELPIKKDDEFFVQNLVSNICVEDEKIFVSSCDKLVCLNRDGEAIWMQGVPRKLTGRSILFTKDSLLFMVNMGYVSWDNFAKVYGVPYIVSFDQRTGLQQSFTSFPSALGKVNYVQLRQDTLLVLFDMHLLKCPLGDTKQMQQMPFPLEGVTDMFKLFAGEKVYFEKNGVYQALVWSDSTKYYLYTQNQLILSVDPDMKKCSSLSPGEYHVSYMTYKGYNFLMNEDETLVIDPDGRLVAHLRLSNKAVRVGNKLFEGQRDKLVIVDLEGIIQ